MRWVLWFVMMSVGTVSADTVDERYMALQKQLVSPCCWSQTLNNHHSEIAGQMRKEIRQMQEAGKSDQEIVTHYVTQYGNRILSQPPASGFNLTAYLLPVGFLLLGGWATRSLLKHWQKARVEAPQPKEQTPIDGVYAARLARDLKAGG